MNLFDVLAILITLTAIFSYINHRFVGLPVTIGVMLIALIMSLALILMGSFGVDLQEKAKIWLESIDFNKTVLHGMLSFLLFAGALHINLDELAERKWTIGSLAVLGTLISTFLVGSALWWVLGLLGVQLSYLYCLLFGALISPTDPIAVLSILKNLHVPKSLEIKIAGESMFNDGIGVVAFLVLLEVTTGTHDVSVSQVGELLAQEAIGGALFGLTLGFVAYHMIKSVDHYHVEILLTLALVAGGYALADSLHLSGPIAMVVAGLVIGNQGRRFAMTEKTCERLDGFWELIDETLNAVLFVLIGLEVLVLTFTEDYLLLGLLAIPIVLLARLVAIGVPIAILRVFREFSPGAVRIMTWAGLRGGISVALALSLPKGQERDLILAITYTVVVFSILVQGLTIEKLIRWVTLRHTTEAG